MSIDLSDDQREAVARGEAVHLRDTEVGVEVVLISAEEYERLVEEAAVAEAQRAWLKQATNTRRRWVSENPY